MVAPALMISGPGWKVSTDSHDGWMRPEFDDKNWQTSIALGAIEDDIDFRQWNSDSGMYRWVGYDGISPFLAHLTLPALKLTDAFEGMGRLDHLDALTLPRDSNSTSPSRFAVTLPANDVSPQEYPSLLLDFGREINGRLEVASDSDLPMEIQIGYGESKEEATREPFLGFDNLYIPPHATVHGPKSSFRYTSVRFIKGGSPLRFKSHSPRCHLLPRKVPGRV